MRWRIRGLQPNRLAQGGLGAIEFLLVAQNGAEIRMKMCCLREQCDGPRDQFDRFSTAANAVFNQPEQMKRFRMLRVQLQHLQVNSPRLFEPPGLLVLDRKIDRLRNGE
ncbi:MAG: hypothetical protein QOE14_1902 [Humisphaera sp.]|nr:hypothetical protein [Humisphaera sp.]